MELTLTRKQVDEFTRFFLVSETLLPCLYFKKNSLSVSRVLCFFRITGKSACHLSDLTVADELYRSTPRHRTSSPTCAGIHDLSTHKLYGILCCQKTRWALTSPFHPYHSISHGGYSLLHYSTLADCFPLRSMVLCVARTFLTLRKVSDKPTNCFELLKTKVRKILYSRKIHNIIVVLHFYTFCLSIFLYQVFETYKCLLCFEN